MLGASEWPRPPSLAALRQFTLLPLRQGFGAGQNACTAQERRGPKGPLGGFPVSSPKAENIDFNRPCQKEGHDRRSCPSFWVPPPRGRLHPSVFQCAGSAKPPHLRAKCRPSGGCAPKRRCGGSARFPAAGREFTRCSAQRPHLEGSLPRPPGDFLPAQDKRRHPLLSDASFCTWVLAPRREAAGHGCQGSVLSAAPRPTSRKYVPLIFSSRWSRFRSWSIRYSVRWASTSSSARPVVTMVSTVW